MTSRLLVATLLIGVLVEMGATHPSSIYSQSMDPHQNAFPVHTLGVVTEFLALYKYFQEAGYLTNYRSLPGQTENEVEGKHGGYSMDHHPEKMDFPVHTVGVFTEILSLFKNVKGAGYPMNYRSLPGQMENRVEGRHYPMNGGSPMDHHHEEMDFPVHLNGVLTELLSLFKHEPEAGYPMNYRMLADQKERLQENELEGKQRPMDGGSSMDHQREEMAMEDEQLLMNGEIQNNILTMMEEAQPQDNVESMSQDVNVRSQRSRRDFLDKYYDWFCTKIGWFCGPPKATTNITISPA